MNQPELETNYPNYCRTCNAIGIFGDLATLQFWECKTCLEKGRCPRCGEDALIQKIKCSKCGWSLNDVRRAPPKS